MYESAKYLETLQSNTHDQVSFLQNLTSPLRSSDLESAKFLGIFLKSAVKLCS